MRQDVSKSKNAEKVRLGVGINVHLDALCLFFVARAVQFRTWAVKSGEVGQGDCRHECDDEE